MDKLRLPIAGGENFQEALQTKQLYLKRSAQIPHIQSHQEKWLENDSGWDRVNRFKIDPQALHNDNGQDGSLKFQVIRRWCPEYYIKVLYLHISFNVLGAQEVGMLATYARSPKQRTGLHRYSIA